MMPLQRSSGAGLAIRDLRVAGNEHGTEVNLRPGDVDDGVAHLKLGQLIEDQLRRQVLLYLAHIAVFIRLVVQTSTNRRGVSVARPLLAWGQSCRTGQDYLVRRANLQSLEPQNRTPVGRVHVPVGRPVDVEHCEVNVGEFHRRIGAMLNDLEFQNGATCRNPNLQVFF